MKSVYPSNLCEICVGTVFCGFWSQYNIDRYWIRYVTATSILLSRHHYMSYPPYPPDWCNFNRRARSPVCWFSLFCIVCCWPGSIRYKIPNSVPISSKEWLNVDELIQVMWETLDLVRVYTKPRGLPPDYNQPVVLRRGKCTVEDFCNSIHKDIAKQMK